MSSFRMDELLRPGASKSIMATAETVRGEPWGSGVRAPLDCMGWEGDGGVGGMERNLTKI